MTKKLLEMQKGFQTAFIDASYDSNLAYKPEFVYNDNKNGQKVKIEMFNSTLPLCNGILLCTSGI